MPDVVSQPLFSSPEVVSEQGQVEPSFRMGGAKTSQAVNPSWDPTKHHISVGLVPLAQKAAV